MREKKIQIKAIIFDLGKVLLDYDLWKAVRRFSRACKIPMSRVWMHFYFSPEEKAYTRGQISSREFYRRVRDKLKILVAYPTFWRYWNDIFSEIEGMDYLLAFLKRHYPLYLISNTNPQHFDFIRKNFKILRHFKKTFPSHRMGCRKPEKEIYLKALTAIGCKPEETIFIDDIPAFVRGARKVGIRALRFKGRNRLVRDLEKLGIRVPVFNTRGARDEARGKP